jgi:cell division protein ZapA
VSQAFEIEVYGNRYTIRGEAEERYVRDLAKEVDEQMRSLAAKMKTVTPLQLAVLTALNFVDELHKCMKQQQQQVEDINRRAESLIGTIQQTLGSRR